MAKVRNSHSSDNVKAVTFGNDTRIEAERPGLYGVISTITWDNSALQHGLRVAFGCDNNEIITAIEITDSGISAKFKRV